jgi:AcrR family transcriptional regulator
VTVQGRIPERGGGTRTRAGTTARKTSGKKEAAKEAAVRESTPGNREKILTTALRLFTEYGVDATPTSRISKEAGVSTGTLFHYFPDKDKLVGALYLSIKKDMAAAIRNNADPSLPTKPRIEKAIRGFIFWGVANQQKVRFIDQCHNYPGIGEDVRQEIYEEFSWMAELIASAVREGLVPDLPFEFHAMMVYQVMSGILGLIESGGSGMSDDEIITNGLAMLWKR